MLLLFYWYILVFFIGTVSFYYCVEKIILWGHCVPWHYICIIALLITLCAERMNQTIVPMYSWSVDHTQGQSYGSYSGQSYIYGQFIWKNHVLVVNKMLFCYFGCNIRCFGIWWKIKELNEKSYFLLIFFIAFSLIISWPMYFLFWQ